MPISAASSKCSTRDPVGPFTADARGSWKLLWHVARMWQHTWLYPLGRIKNRYNSSSSIGISSSAQSLLIINEIKIRNNLELLVLTRQHHGSPFGYPPSSRLPESRLSKHSLTSWN